MKQNAIIIVKLDSPTSRESEWNSWYNTTHAPARLAVPGFNGVRRFMQLGNTMPQCTSPGEPKYLTVYEIDSPNVVNHEAYINNKNREIALPPDSFEFLTNNTSRLARGIYKQKFPEVKYQIPPTQFLLVESYNVPGNRQQEFNAWIGSEYFPAVLKTPGIINCRSFKLTGEVPPRTINGGSLSEFLAIYDVEDPEALNSEIFKAAGTSPRSQWVNSQITNKTCVVYKRIFCKLPH